MCDAIAVFAQGFMNQTRAKIWPLSVAVFSAVFASGCGTRSDSLLSGAATGAMVGGLLKGTGRDMVRGAAIGAVGGYVLGKEGEYDRHDGSFCAHGPAYFAPPEAGCDRKPRGRGESVTWGQF